MKKIVLIGNYLPDKQESMVRFAEMLQKNFSISGKKAEILYPPVVFGKLFSNTSVGIGKWIAYIDKYIVFPFFLKVIFFRSKNTHFHICDHSNAPYRNFLPNKRTSITCHDVIAIRGGLGLDDTCPPGSKIGVILQKWILKSLSKIHYIASVSNVTDRQLKQLVKPSLYINKDWRVIHNAFNADFSTLPPGKVQERLEKAGILKGEKFILHVGSGLDRKNRELLVDLAYVLGDKWQGYICLAGEQPGEELLKYAQERNLGERLKTIVKPDHELLSALYNGCEAFIFPSLSEGFGWPIIEAQASGAPVLASNIETLVEVSGGAAIHLPAKDSAMFATFFLQLGNADFKNNLVKKGLENCDRFRPEKMTSSYLDFFGVKI